ncbi:MAG: hypothetical protein AUF76_13030 [Acidobacteria bacterium 13_1_20CM_2_65_9]|jgi:hypothetical protein|nr:MAG: hypothetical protein AUF76_13030 [Acidobacteria bacterium 13_1_20CM_2_65_9]
MQSGDGDYLLSSPLMHRDDERLVDRSRHIGGARSLTHMGVNDQSRTRSDRQRENLARLSPAVRQRYGLYHVF